ncbi:YdcF family protein [Sphingomonas bacterium]|uniref:YdcF family protein n=1 Tax=Sphingomonas bacterium TaxID=1895847 RepID=UPI0034A02C70
MLRLIATLALLWTLGLALFATILPPPADLRRTDGIIVLTGGPGRLARGLQVLKAGKADRLLISGVDPRVDAQAIARANHVPDALMRLVDLGRGAVDTRTNADEAAAWIAAHHYRSIRLVTADWHMRRARLELARVLGKDIAILPDGVRGEPGLAALAREYDKYLLRRAAMIVGY